MNNRGLRGGAFNNNDNNLQASNRNNNSLTSQKVRGANRLRAQCLLGEALDTPARDSIRASGE